MPPDTLPALTPLQETLWLTLCGRALDNRLPRPILGDEMADEIVREAGYDYKKFGLIPSAAINIAHRAKKLDEVAQRFFARHPDGVGLDLGAGLDSRVLRISPPPTADWYDIDFPEVVAARRQLLPARATPPWHRRRPDRPRVAGHPAHRPARGDRRRRADRVPLHGGDDRLGGPPHRSLPKRGDSLQRVRKLPRLGPAAPSHGRHPSRQGHHQVPRPRRSPGRRTLAPQAEAGQGDPVHPGA
ncbi:class I SAM-dependent methyltransferase [Nonomuraea sp. NPDC049129]|uniref:class I SAM-dependent methyltransferase n=1 Tax=Nonomuraea sp. NPDC049129 TaxID=3155272 RepID=UPI0033E25DB1